MALTQKEAAELKRQKGELETKRLALKEKVKNHRGASTEELNETADQLRTISEQIDDINEKLADAPADNKRGLFGRPEEITAENFRSSAKYRDAFYRSHLNGRIAESDAEVMDFGKRAITDMNGGSVTSGAQYIVPQTTLDQILTIIVKYGRLYSAITKYGFTGDVTLPIGHTGAPTVNSEGIAELTFSFTETKISQAAVVATITVKNLLLKNSIPAFESFIAGEIGKYIGLQLENYVLNGSLSNSSFLGILTALKEAPSAVKDYADMDWATIAAILGSLESPYGDQGTWVMKRSTFFNRFFSLTDAAGKPLTTIAPVSGGPGTSNYLIAGMPVIFTSQMPDDDGILYGDLSMYIVNESEAFGIEANASEKFSEDKTVWRGKVYSGGTPVFAKETFTYWTFAADPET